ncbi:MAG: long-chain fatty acid--CoA ligase [Betaproteobacteria bacterium]|nr:long-chain fatty acid--CoA ligase [Betaproteobacteria bacterium]MDH5220667.1 long-chain fatty acid--CoA ligase [Betaproteobacteria bacterium]MDH5351349.1 long-chain fatty acid--CoA ligase [Betaproteobacteria bacterium]
MNLAQLLHSAARRLPQAPALAVGTRTVASYAQFAARVARLAGGLRARGLAPGDRVALAMKNCPEYYELLFACWHAGLAAVPINAKLHAREFAYILENSGARLAFVTPDLAPAIPGALSLGSPDWRRLAADAPLPVADVAPDDLAWLFYTSGTTGVPKGAMLTHRNLLFATQAYYADIDRLAPGDSILHAAPMSHGSGLYGVPHVAAGALNVIPESGGFEPEEILALITAHGGVSFFAAPTMIVRLLASPAAGDADLRNLKTITYGGAPMYVADAGRAIDLFGPRLYQLFGQGESPMTITGLPQPEHAARTHLETCGYARTGVEVRVVDDEDRDLPPGEVGEILTRSDCVMAGYWRNAEATAQALRGGWLHTGDLGSLDAAGYLTIRDRSKDMIISGGSNIYPREIEEVLLRHPAVAECSVIGRPHAEWGEEVVAFVVRRGAVTPQDLDELCLAHIARFKRPRDYRFVDSLPKNNYGKVLKTELRRLATA